MPQHELDPSSMARLIESGPWQHYLRDFLLPTFTLARQHYDGASQDHRFFQGWMLALALCIETPYKKVAGRRSPLELQWNGEGPQITPSPVVEETPVEEPLKARPLRRSTFPV